MAKANRKKSIRHRKAILAKKKRMLKNKNRRGRKK